jgi:hypothetical protein
VNRRARVVAGLLLLLTFSVGGLAGMAVEEALGLDWFDFLDEDYGGGADRLLVGLDLSHDQRARVEEILHREEDRLEDYWESRIPEIQGMLAQSYAEIRATLTSEQQAAFDRRVRALGGRVPAEIRD